MPLGSPTLVSSAGIRIEMNKSDLMRVNVMLAGVKDGAATVLMRATNKTLAGVLTDTVNEIRKGVNVTAKAVRDTITLHKAGKTDLRARVESKQYYGTSLAQFGARSTTKGVTVQVLKRSGRKLVKHAFMMKHKGGNVVFWRTQKEFVGKGKKPFVRRKWVSMGRSGGMSQIIPFYGALPDKYRLPIEKLWGPAVPDLMQHEPTFRAIEKKAGERLSANMKHELDYLLSRL